MNGTIITFDASTGQGLIRSHDGQRYRFHDGEWLDAARRPATGSSVDFEFEGKEARQIAVINAPNFNSGTNTILSEGTKNGVVLGSVSIVFGVLALMPAFGVLMAIIGGVTGFIGRSQAKVSDHTNGKMLSIIGLSISMIVLSVQIVALFAVSSVFMML